MINWNQIKTDEDLPTRNDRFYVLVRYENGMEKVKTSSYSTEYGWDLAEGEIVAWSEGEKEVNS